jgi:hypothetical protein
MIVWREGPSTQVAFIDGQDCVVQRVAPFSWLVTINGVTYKRHLTRSRAAKWAENFVRNHAVTRSEGGWRRLGPS